MTGRRFAKQIYREGANDTAGEQVDDDTEIQPAFVRPQIGDVGHPDLIGPGRLKPLLQPVLGHHGGVDIRPAQRPPPVMPAGHTVLRDALALITQIVRQLAIAIDLAAVGPSLPDQLGLAKIFLREVA